MNTEGLTRALGLCRRAGKIVCGTPMVIEAVRSEKNRPFIVIEAADSSDGTHKKLTDKCGFYGVKHTRVPLGTEELAHAVGKTGSVAALAVSDENLAALVEKNLVNTPSKENLS